MLPEAGAFELVFLAMVALIVVGPKDLPVLLRKLGQFTAKMRGLAAEFRASFDEMARQSELDDLRKEVEALRAGQLAAIAPPEVEGHIHEINRALTEPSAPRQEEAAPAPTPAEPLLPFEGPSPSSAPPLSSAPSASAEPVRESEPALAHEPQA